MSGQGVAWPNVLADLEFKRDALTSIIDTIRMHFVGDTPGEMPDSAAQARGARRPKSGQRGGTNKQTNKQTNKARRRPGRQRGASLTTRATPSSRC